MAVKATQLYNTNFFSQVGTEYVCTGFMYGMATAGSLDDQLAEKGVFMASQVLTDPTTGEVYPMKDQETAAMANQAKSTGGASSPGMSSKPGGGTGAGY